MTTSSFAAQVFEKNLAEAVDRWKLAKETGTIRDCKQDGERDALAGDGVVSYGQRSIAKDGSFRFANARWQNDLLIPLAGKRIGVCAEDYWLQAVQVWTEYPGGKWLMSLRVS